MTTPEDVIKRLGELSLDRIDAGALASNELCVAGSMLPFCAQAPYAARAGATANGIAEARFREIAERGRLAAAEGLSRNKEIVLGIVGVFEDFSFSEYRSWVAGFPPVRAGMQFDLGVPEDKQAKGWESIGKTFARSHSRLRDPAGFESLVLIDMLAGTLVEPEWALLSPFNWTKFAGETCIALGSLAAAGAAITANIYLLIPAGVLLIGGACLKQLGERKDG